MTRLNAAGLQGGVVKDSRKLELQNVSNCWICEGWSQHSFEYQPGVSDDQPEHDKFIPINLHLDIDHFEPDLMLPIDPDEEFHKLY